MVYFPVMILTYNRLTHTRRTIESLARNTLAAQTDLFIFSDGPQKGDEESVAQTRSYLETIKTGFKSVTLIKAEKNKNIFASTIDAGNYLCQKFNAFIGLEDDIDTHPYFLQYMNDALNFYKDNKKVAAVMGYTHEPFMKAALKKYPHNVVFSYAFHSFGWGTWRDRWEKFDWSMPNHEAFLQNKREWKEARMYSWGHLRAAAAAGKPTSELWDVRLSYYLFKNKLLCAWPRYSYTNNIGFDGTGLHKYNFAKNMFAFPLKNAKEKAEFTHDINMTKNLHLKMEVAVSARWILSFLTNVQRLVLTPIAQYRVKKALKEGRHISV